MPSDPYSTKHLQQYIAVWFFLTDELTDAMRIAFTQISIIVHLNLNDIQQIYTQLK